MKTGTAIKFAVSALALGTTMVACKPAAQAFRPVSASAATPKAEKEAAASFTRAEAAAQKGDFAAALAPAERAVELSPRDAGYRMLLADLYLKNGRFQSAATTFGDVLSLDPGNPRASISIALADIATGRNDAAVDRLEKAADTAPPSDVGLAFALAGHAQRAIEILEPAVREAGANARLRQNLAFAYALAGDWPKARSLAAQDVSPADLGRRLEQWAALAKPSAPGDRVAALLGVRPGADDGQPVRLALAQPAATAFAAAEPAPEPAPQVAAALAPVEASAPSPAPAADAPVQSASSDVPAWIAAAQAAEPQPREETKPVYADAVQSLVATPPAAAPRLAPVRHFERPAGPVLASAIMPDGHAGPGRFAVQLGAFASPAGVERGWAQAYRRYGFENHTPLSTTFAVRGRGTFHRLSVAGFASREDAGRVCRTVRAKGGACFVRAVAGDAPVRWASRYPGTDKG
ncbi:MAG TPA: tetratricopeptide repeat protein [Allosphingosinicella sp.]|jgi:Flp pilus assembly protein TadD